MDTITRNGPNRKGQALIEFALVSAFLVFFILGAFDVGRAVYGYGVVSSAARDGARAGILDPTNTSAIRAAAMANTAGLDASQITIPTPFFLPSCTVDCSLTVTVTYRFRPASAFFLVMNLTGVSTMTIE
jgi:Flp pilus assembly protein TadG